MSAIEPAGEKIVRNLQKAVERLHDDIARVELWAEALQSFTKPVPEYDPAESHLNAHMLSSRDQPHEQKAAQITSLRTGSGPESTPVLKRKIGRTGASGSG